MPRCIRYICNRKVYLTATATREASTTETPYGSYNDYEFARNTLDPTDQQFRWMQKAVVQPSEKTYNNMINILCLLKVPHRYII